MNQKHQPLCAARLATVLLLFGVSASVVGCSDNSSASASSTSGKLAESRAETDRKDREINIVLAGATWLKGTMKKPESFAITRATMIDGKVVCLEYTSRNSWNDVRPGVYVISDDVSSSEASAWNRLCAGKSGDDYTSVRAVMR